MMDTQKIIDRLDGIYGKGRGMEVYMNIMPGILADFEKMVKTSKAGQRIAEQYRSEDGRAELTVTGARNGNGTLDMSIEVTAL
ncbi:MAG: hypothetical protein K6G22_10400 [Lachnospiraceae bacterium]|nr:hypothetical protein [Lachnospiraceae bacterium]